MLVTEEYRIRCGERQLGSYYVFEDGSSEFRAFRSLEPPPEEAEAMGLTKDRRSKSRLALFKALQEKGERVPGTRKAIWRDGPLTMERIPKDAEKFYIYRRMANKGDADYSPKPHAAPHYEGKKTPAGMEEWASWYAFNKKEDGMFEAELDEAWDEGSHYGGGTIRVEVPEGWLDLPWEELTERLVTLSAASRYGFTPEDLRAKAGLRAFFGYE